MVVCGHTKCGAVKAAVAQFVEDQRARDQLASDSASEVSAEEGASPRADGGSGVGGLVGQADAASCRPDSPAPSPQKLLPHQALLQQLPQLHLLPDHLKQLPHMLAGAVGVGGSSVAPSPSAPATAAAADAVKPSAFAAAAASSHSPRDAGPPMRRPVQRGIRGLGNALQRLWAVLGGAEASEALVRTASFR